MVEKLRLRYGQVLLLEIMIIYMCSVVLLIIMWQDSKLDRRAKKAKFMGF